MKQSNICGAKGLSYSVVTLINQKWKEFVEATKSFKISKLSVWEAWKSVRENHGAHGVDKQSIENRMNFINLNKGFFINNYVGNLENKEISNNILSFIK